MQVEVKLFASLRRLLPPGSSGGKTTLTLPEGATLLDLLQALKVPLELAQMVLVDGEQTRDFSRPLKDGASVSVFPPVAGGKGWRKRG